LKFCRFKANTEDCSKFFQCFIWFKGWIPRRFESVEALWIETKEKVKFIVTLCYEKEMERRYFLFIPEEKKSSLEKKIRYKRSDITSYLFRCSRMEIVLKKVNEWKSAFCANKKCVMALFTKALINFKNVEIIKVSKTGNKWSSN
jgi:hypothetical protein